MSGGVISSHRSTFFLNRLDTVVVYDYYYFFFFFNFEEPLCVISRCVASEARHFFFV